MSKKIHTPITDENSLGFDQKCVDVLSEASVNKVLNQRLYTLSEKDFSEIKLKLLKSKNLKIDLENLVESEYFHQKENLKLFYRRLKKTRSIASE